MDLQRACWLVCVLLLAAANLLNPTPTKAAEEFPKVRSTIVVTADYPGASAQVLAENVAAPIETHINGVEKLLHMVSRCGNDGNYRLILTFRDGVDPRFAQAMVQNRVSLALPVLPDLVKRNGVTVRMKSPSPLLLVSLSAPGGRFDTLYLSNYARIQIQDELVRLPGVAETNCLGKRDFGVQIWIDPQKLNSRKLTVNDVLAALKAQNVPPKLLKDKDGETITVETPGRLRAMEEFGNVILKTKTPGQTIRLKEVARIEQGPTHPEGEAGFNGKPVILLAIHTLPQARASEVTKAVRARLAQLRERLPEGLRLEVAFDFTPNREALLKATPHEYLFLDLILPAVASRQRTERVLEHCQAFLKKYAGIENVLTLTEHPLDLSCFPNRGYILVQLTPAAKRKTSLEQIARTIRGQLAGEILDAMVRVRNPAATGRFQLRRYPVDLALHGPELEKVREWAKNLARRLSKNPKLTDVWANRDSDHVPQIQVEIDRGVRVKQSVEFRDIVDTLQTFLGPLSLNDFKRFGPALVQIQTKGTSDRIKDIKQLKIRDSQGKMISLGSLAKVRQIMAPEVIHRFDGRPMVEITANLAPGAPVDPRKLCETAAEEVRKEMRLPKTYRLTWLELD